MDELHLTYAVAGALAVGLALVSRQMRHLPLSEPMLALAAGIVLGPQLLGLVELSEHTRDLIFLEGGRLVLAVSVMGAAIRFPASGLRKLVRPILVLLLVVMPVAALVTGAASLLLGIPVALAALIGACLCPTDPVLAGSVVSGDPAERDLPGPLRHILSAESGINDGLALPFVGLAIALVLPATTPGAEVGRLAWEVVAGVLIGVVVGALAGWGVRIATKDHELEPAPDLVLTIILAVAVLGIARTAATDGILAVFVAGTVYNRMVTESEREPQQGIDEAVNRYLVVPLFLVLGAVLPWQDWVELGPAAVGLVLLVLALRRLPAVLLLTRPSGLAVRDATFLGWFGPMGVSSLFYLAHSMDKGVSDPRLFAAVTLVVAASVVAFGLSSSPGRKIYAKRAERSAPTQATA